jgi:hypothetical protein
MSIQHTPPTTVSSRAVTVNVESGDVLLPITPDVAKEVGRCSRTIKRWITDPRMNFPRTTRIRDRLYVSRREFETWKRELFIPSLNGNAL